jgi:hypothetical protein
MSGVTRRLWCCPDSADLDQFEAECFDLREDAEQRGPIFKQTGEQVSPPSSSDSSVGNADRAVAPSRPRIRIAYKHGGVAT